MSETETSTLTPEGGGVTLPSEQAEVKTLDTFIAENTSDNGKLYGRFDTPAEALEHFRAQEVTHTNKMRELKDGQKAQEQETQTQQEQREAEQTRNAKVNELVPAFITNGMQLNDEMISALEETGISKAEIELGAYKGREATTTAFNTVGGEDNYKSMLAWAGENLDAETKTSFDNDISAMMSGKSQVGSLAIEGLYARFEKAGGQAAPQSQERISGGQQSAPERGYASQKEMLADKRAAEGSRDPGALQRYQRKLGKTSDQVIFGH